MLANVTLDIDMHILRTRSRYSLLKDKDSSREFSYVVIPEIEFCATELYAQSRRCWILFPCITFNCTEDRDSAEQYILLLVPLYPELYLQMFASKYCITLYA